MLDTNREIQAAFYRAEALARQLNIAISEIGGRETVHSSAAHVHVEAAVMAAAKHFKQITSE